MIRKILVFAVVVLIASAIQAETVTNRITRSTHSRTYAFWPGGAHVELTLMWLKEPVLLILLVRCADEIGSVFFEATGESIGDRIERFDFGGWSGGTCTVTVFDLNEDSRTKFLLNLRFSFDEDYVRDSLARRPRARLTSVPTASVPGLEARLTEHRARLRAAR